VPEAMPVGVCAPERPGVPMPLAGALAPLPPSVWTAKSILYVPSWEANPTSTVPLAPSATAIPM